jgi:hypothetical protein
LGIKREGIEPVMIGSDFVTISLFDFPPPLYILPNRPITTAGSGGQGIPIKFSEFDGGFQVTENDAIVYNDSVKGGDRWELV